MKSYLILFLVVLGSTIGNAQKSVQDLNAYFAALRNNPTLPLPKSVLDDGQNEAVLITALVPYLGDTLEAIRGKAYNAISSIGQKSTDVSVRQSAVTFLAQGIKDKSTGIGGSAGETLTNFNREDFISSTRKLVGDAVDIQTPHVGQVVKLVGYLKLTEYTNKIVALTKAKASSKVKWASRLALARMGNEEAIEYVLTKMGTASVNDDFIYDIAPDLIYTRQRKLFNYLVSIVNSDTYLCESADPDSGQKILCAYRVMEYVASVIENNPLKVDNWGTLNENNYQQALQDLRKWLLQNPNYKIKDNGY